MAEVRRGAKINPDGLELNERVVQVNRVAKARGVSPDQVRELVLANQDGRVLGFLGEAKVNVLQLNIALDQKYPVKS